MIIIIGKETVHFNGILNGENVISEITKINANTVYFNFKSESENVIGTLKEIANSLTGENNLNLITAGKLLSEKLTELSIPNELKINLDWVHKDFGIRISIPNQIILDSDFYNALISDVKTKKFPYYYKDDTATIYVSQIDPDHLAHLEADNNVLIEY